MVSDNTVNELQSLLKDVDDEAERRTIATAYFKNKTENYRSRVRKMSLEELDNVVGGGGGIISGEYECDSNFSAKCGAISYSTSLDICLISACDDYGRDRELTPDFVQLMISLYPETAELYRSMGFDV